MTRTLLVIACTVAGFAGCSEAASPPVFDNAPFKVSTLATFERPWAMTFLPDGHLLVTGKTGILTEFDAAARKTWPIRGVPKVAYGGQGGLGDVVLHPKFADNGWLYLSYAEAGEGDTSGAAVARAKLVRDAGGGGTLEDLTVIWRQVPKLAGNGHYGHRLAFSPDGHLFISSGERQAFDPAQDMGSNLGKIVRLDDDGSVPADNPFAGKGKVAAQVWSLGHRNPLGLAFDARGQLWNHEMGPRGGDELNRVRRGANYGYPIVSNGDHYDGRDIPDHVTRPEFEAPAVTWNPVISPAGLVFYSGDRYAGWKGNALIGGLSSSSLVRVAFDGDTAKEVARYDLRERVREVEQAPDGSVWVLQDGGPLLRLDPVDGR